MASDESFTESPRAADGERVPWVEPPDEGPVEVLTVYQPGGLPGAPPSKPHPGFWWGVLWTCGMMLVAQIIPGIVIAVVAVAVLAAQSSDFDAAMKQLGTEQGTKDLQRQVTLPSLLASQVLLAAFSWLALRLVIGKQWPREVALRLPSATHFVLALVALPALTTLAGGAYTLAKLYFPDISQILTVMAANLAVILLVGMVWLFYLGLTGTDLKDRLRFSHPATQLVVAYVVLTVCIVVGGGVYLVLSPYLPTITLFGPGIMEDMVKEFRSWPWPAAVLIIGLGPGIAEELWCRAFLGRGFIGQYGPVAGIMLASFFFGWIHLDPHQGIMAATMGLALHFSYVMTRSLLVPMMLHFLNNAISVVADKINPEVEKIDTAPETIHWTIYASAAFLLVAVAWALYRSRARLQHRDGPGRPHWQPAYPTVALPPRESNTVVTHPRPGWLASLLVVAAAVCFGVAFYAAESMP